MKAQISSKYVQRTADRQINRVTDKRAGSKRAGSDTQVHSGNRQMAGKLNSDMKRQSGTEGEVSLVYIE